MLSSVLCDRNIERRTSIVLLNTSPWVTVLSKVIQLWLVIENARCGQHTLLSVSGIMHENIRAILAVRRTIVGAAYMLASCSISSVKSIMTVTVFNVTQFYDFFAQLCALRRSTAPCHPNRFFWELLLLSIATVCVGQTPKNNHSSCHSVLPCQPGNASDWNKCCMALTQFRFQLIHKLFSLVNMLLISVLKACWELSAWT